MSEKDERVGRWKRTDKGNLTRRFQDEDGEWHSVTVFEATSGPNEGSFKFVCEDEFSEVAFDDEFDALHQAEQDLIPRGQWSDW